MRRGLLKSVVTVNGITLLMRSAGLLQGSSPDVVLRPNNMGMIPRPGCRVTLPECCAAVPRCTNNGGLDSAKP